MSSNWTQLKFTHMGDGQFSMWPKWIDNIGSFFESMEAVPHTRTQFFDMCGWIFEQVTNLTTSFPIEILETDRVLAMTLTFSGMSAAIVAIMSIKEGFKAVLGMQYTKLTTFIGRSVVAFIGAGMTLPAMIFITKTLNIIIHYILSIGHSSIAGSVQFSSVFADLMSDGSINFLVGILFMIAFCIFSLKMLLDAGRRWFDMIVQAVISPIAWASSVSDTTKSFFSTWLNTTFGLFLTNLVYAFYLTVVIGIVMSPWEMATMGGMFGRLLLLVGAIYRLVSPPSWVTSLGGNPQQGKGLIGLIAKMTMLGKMGKLK